MVLAAPALAQDNTAIEKLNERFSAAFVKGDIATVAEMYTEDACLLPAGSPMMRGRSAISHSGKTRAKASITYNLRQWTLRLSAPMLPARLARIAYTPKAPSRRK